MHVPCHLWPVGLYHIFPDFHTNGMIFGKKKYWTQSVCFNLHLSFWKEFIEILSYMYIGLHVKYQLLLLDFNETCIFSANFLKIPKYQISWKYVQWNPSCFLWTEGQTDMTKLIATFHIFMNVPLKTSFCAWEEKSRYWLILGERLKVPESTASYYPACSPLKIV